MNKLSIKVGRRTAIVKQQPQAIIDNDNDNDNVIVCESSVDENDNIDDDDDDAKIIQDDDYYTKEFTEILKSE